MNKVGVWIDFGWWPQPGGTRRLLSWNAETGELAFWPLNREDTIVVAVIENEDEVVARMQGWEMFYLTPEGPAWLAARVRGCEP